MSKVQFAHININRSRGKRVNSGPTRLYKAMTTFIFFVLMDPTK